MTKVVKLQIIKPINQDWKLFGDILFNIRNDTRQIKNKAIQECWEYQGFSSEYKDKFEEYPKPKDVLNYSGLSGYIYNKYKLKFNRNNKGNYTTIITEAVDMWKSDIKDVLRGDKSIRNYKSDLPLDLHNKSINLIKESNEYYLDLSLISNQYKKELELKSGKFLVLIKVNDNNVKSTLDKILNNEYKISASKLIRKKNKWFINLCFSFETIASSSLSVDNIMGVDMGIIYPAYMAFNNSLHRYNIEGSEIEQFRKSIESRKNKLYRQGKYCSEGRIGHGIKTRIRPIDFAIKRVSNFRDTTNHKYSKYIIEMAMKHNCGVIQIEDLKYISKDNTFLKKWSYDDLQNKIIYKAKEKGIKIIKINPKYTSQRCSKCGYIHKDNRKTQEKFLCLNCEFEANADYNAAKNISTQDIELIIKHYEYEQDVI